MTTNMTTNMTMNTSMDNNHEHDELGINWHVWYSPEISKIVAQKVAEKLSIQYPAKKSID